MENAANSLVPARPDSGMDGEFRRMVEANEALKEIVRISRQVELSALNAMVNARRAGQSAAGFGVVAGELRRFSRQLEETVSGLTEQLFAMVADVAHIGIAQRRRRMLAMAVMASTRGACLAAVVDGSEARLQALKESMLRDRSRLRQRLGQALKLCVGGRAVSRASLIEAVHGNEFMHVLGQVAHEMETSIERVIEIIGTIERRLARQD